MSRARVEEATQTLRAVVMYDGSGLCGFQRQAELPTVGGILEETLGGIFHFPVAVAAAGRTDAGVHASGQVISFEAPANFPIERLCLATNALLPPAVSLHEPQRMPEGWSARFAALERRYVYLLHASRERHALRARYFGFEPRPLDIDRMREAARDLCGRQDFRSFCGVPPKNHTERTLLSLSITSLDPQTLRFELSADGFVHRMVRIIVGTLVEIGTGYRTVDCIPAVLAAKDRRLAGHTASPTGLYLAGVKYLDFDSFREPWVLGAARA